MFVGFSRGMPYALSTCMSANIPKVGSLVSPSGSDIKYRVVEAGEFGCRVESVDTKLHYSIRRFSLSISRETGMLFDAQWRGWKVV